MKKILVVVLSLGLLACGSDKVKVIHNGDRVALLEARADLNDATDSLLASRVADLESRASALESSLSATASDLAAYKTATDAALDTLLSKDEELSLDIEDILEEIAVLNSTDTDLQNHLNNLTPRVEALEDRLSNVEGSFPSLAARLNSMKNQINTLNTKVASLEVFRALQTAQNIFVQIQIASLDSRIDSNSSDISSLTNEVNNLSITVQNMSVTFNSSLDDLQQQIVDIELTPGPQGPAGPAGPQGAPGSGVVAVPLCAGNTASYPEHGLVIGGKTYGVYYGPIGGSTQAFLTLLSPGNWRTTDGGNCNFTIGSNGLVQ